MSSPMDDIPYSRWYQNPIGSFIDVIAKSRWYSLPIGRYIFYFLNAFTIAAALDLMFVPGLLLVLLFHWIIEGLTGLSHWEQSSIAEASPIFASIHVGEIRFIWAIPSFLLSLGYIYAWSAGTNKNDSIWLLVVIACLATVLSSAWYLSLS